MSDGKAEAAWDDREEERRARDLLDKLLTLGASGEVKRLHTVPTHRQQNNAEHVFGSLLVAMELLEREDPSGSATANVLVTLLYHDAPEVETGDVPAPVKRASKAINEALAGMEARFYRRLGLKLPPLSKKEQAIVKASDTADLALTCLRERRLGNRNPELGHVFSNCLEYLKEYNLPSVALLRLGLEREWNNDD